jgi:hypothetical protein
MIKGFANNIGYELKLDKLKIKDGEANHSWLVGLTTETNYAGTAAPMAKSVLYIAIKNRPRLLLTDLPKIEVTLSFTVSSNSHALSFVRVFTPWKITLERQNRLTDKTVYYYYRIEAGHEQLWHFALASRLSKVYDVTSAKQLIKEALVAAGLKETEFNLDNLKTTMFTANKGYYVQTVNQTAQEFILQLLAQFGASVYLQADTGILYFLDTPTYTNSSELCAAMTDTTVHARSHYPLIVSPFCVSYTTRPVTAVTIGAYSIKNKNQLNVGTNTEESKPGTYHFVTSHEATVDTLNQYAKNLVPKVDAESPEKIDQSFTGKSVFPFELGLQYTIQSTDFDGEETTLRLTPVSIKACYTFFPPIDGGQPDIYRWADWTQLPPEQFTHQVTFIDIKFLPRVPFQAPANIPLTFDAVVLDQNGKLTGKPVTGKEMIVGLLHGHNREANTPFEQVKVQRRITDPSIDSAVPVPGQVVSLRFNPITHEFLLDGIIRDGGFSEDTTYENNKNQEHPVHTKTVVTPTKITTNVEDAKVVMDKERVDISVSDNTALLDKKGTAFTTKEKFNVKGKSITLQGTEEMNTDAPKMTITGSSEFNLSGEKGKIKASGPLSVLGKPVSNNA